MNINDVTKLKAVASQEDDKQHYDEQRSLAHANGGDFETIANMGDIFIAENKTHYVINDCGVCTLYVKKEYEGMWFQLCGRGQRPPSDNPVAKICDKIKTGSYMPESTRLLVDHDNMPLVPGDSFERILKKIQFVAKTRWPLGTPDAALLHLEREIDELKKSFVSETRDEQLLEFADCLSCIFVSMFRAGVTVDEIKKVLRIKTDINANREWKYNGDGTYSHVKEKKVVDPESLDNTLNPYNDEPGQ